MIRTLITLVAGIGVGASGLFAVQHAAERHDGEKVTILSEQDIVEKLDGKDTKATLLEVVIEPGEEGFAHRHPGPGFGFVVEGEYEWAIDDQPARRFKAGDTFYEPTGVLHRVSKNPAEKGRTRVLAVVLHPRDAKEIAIPEPVQQ